MPEQDPAVWDLAIRVQTTLDPGKYDLCEIVAQAENEADAAIVGYDCRLIGPEEVEESAVFALNLRGGGEEGGEEGHAAGC